MYGDRNSDMLGCNQKSEIGTKQIQTNVLGQTNQSLLTGVQRLAMYLLIAVEATSCIVMYIATHMFCSNSFF